MNSVTLADIDKVTDGVDRQEASLNRKGRLVWTNRLLMHNLL
jgi:hypothetical protein